jgi:hypothetical protein
MSIIFYIFFSLTIKQLILMFDIAKYFKKRIIFILKNWVVFINSSNLESSLKKITAVFRLGITVVR